MNKKKSLIVQCVVFNKDYFTRKMIKSWIEKNNFILLKSKEPIRKYGKQLRVRQKNPNLFNHNSFKTKIIKKGKIFLVLGKLK